MSIYAKLSMVQSELKAPKGQYNSFGKYKYRSCEDIVEAVKPICIKNGIVLNLTDEIVQIADRIYVKAIAQITEIESGEKFQTAAYAREEFEKKGMDGSQITGAASSYARKYAMNGLFAIDDTKDADTQKPEIEPKNEIESKKEPLVPCKVCGKMILKSMAQKSIDKYGAVYCSGDCKNKAANNEENIQTI